MFTAELFLLFASVLMPVILYGLTLYFIKDTSKGLIWGLVMALVSQVFLRSSLMALLTEESAKAYFSENLYAYCALWAGLTTVVTIGFSWLMLRFPLRKQGMNGAIGYGIGFGSFQAFLLSGISVLSVLFGSTESGGDVSSIYAVSLTRLLFFVVHLCTMLALYGFIAKKQTGKLLLFTAGYFVLYTLCTICESVYTNGIWMSLLALFLITAAIAYLILYKNRAEITKSIRIEE